MKINKNPKTVSKLSFIGLIVTIGIVYGDIGTSPLYVMKAIVEGASIIDTNYILGAISCIIWTLTLQTTVKYIIITLRADNKGEGGIFALYTLLRRNAKWVFIFALIGGSTLLADGIITPSITVVSAIEGLKLLNPDIPVVPIVLLIITGLFVIQQFGTNFLGKSFGPIMFLWFFMLGILGFVEIIKLPLILKAFNPVYAYNLLANYPHGFLLLGAVFLCTTGAEALYSDLGHCGLQNIRFTWIYVKITLILNYLGQGAWILTHNNPQFLYKGSNPFFAMMPSWFLIYGITLATIAAVIASQALISGSYTIISEAITLNFWPKVKIKYPTIIHGQMYIPSINWLLWIACLFVIIFFKESSNMEAAYGLSITITMLMTTILLGYYLYFKKVPKYIILIFIFGYLAIEGSFLIANLNKFSHGGWVTILIASLLFVIMYVWSRGRKIKNRFSEYVKIDDCVELIKSVSEDKSITKYATFLVFLTNAKKTNEIESKILYSIINKQPKRADVYWFVHVDFVDEPYRKDFSVTTIAPNDIYRIDFHLGFKVEPRINLFFRYVIDNMVENKEINIISNYDSLKSHKIPGDFRFVVIDRIQNYDFDFSPFEQMVMDIYDKLKKIGISDIKAYGLDTSNVTTEIVPLVVYQDKELKLERLK